jgi:transcriptional regulator with XRE-family HTH domain
MTLLEELRRKAGLTVKELSEHTGLGESTIQRIEDGNEPRTVTTARALAFYFRIEWERFYPDSVLNTATPS